MCILKPTSCGRSLFRRIGTATCFALACLAVAPAQAAIKHQYLFNDGTANDSAGTAHGTLINGAAVANGRVSFDGTDDHVSLDAATIGINTYTALSLEAWISSSPSNLNKWTMVAALGQTTSGTLPTCNNCGYNYLMLQPTRAPGDQGSRVAITANTFDAEAGVTNGATDIADGLLHQMVMTLNATNISYYLDGALVGSATNNVALNSLSNSLGYLGRSLYQDPYYAGSVNQFTIHDTALTAGEVTAAFTAGPIGGGVIGPALEVNRDTGAVRLTNDTGAIRLLKYSIASASGTLNSTTWSPIANTGDSDSGGSFDNNDMWGITNQTDLLLSEEEPVGGGGPDDGGALTASRALGTGVWRKSRFEDLVATYTTLEGGLEVTSTVPIVYTGHGGLAYRRSDIDLDGDVDANDYVILKNNLHKTLTGTNAYATSLQGDLDGDLKNNFADYRIFQTDYSAAFGEAAFVALAASVPEPASVLLVMLMGVALVMVRRRQVGAAAVTASLLVAASAQGATVAHWNFETDLIAGSAVAGQVVSHPSADGAHDDALADISGNNNHLSAFAQNGAYTAMLFSNTVLPSNATASTLSIENKPGECCPALSAQGDLEVGGVKVGALAQWTLEASVNLKTLGTWQTIIGKDGGPENGDIAAPLYFQKVGDGSQKFRINYRDVAGNRWIADSTTVATAGTWYNLAASSDGTNLKMYVNGILETTTPIVSANAAMVPLDETGYAGGAGVTNAPNGWSLARGMFNDGHVDRLDGFLDDVRISNAALTANQLLNNFIPSLTLVVNTVNGNVSLKNDAATALPLDYYEVTSAGGALRFADGQWNSLNDQNTDSLGAGNGQSWDEAGGASANILSEVFLLGQSSLNRGQSISLGAPFNTATFGSGIDGDLAFKFSPKGGALKASRVQYITAAGTPGDYNNDGKVNAADYSVWRDANGTNTTLPNDSTPGTVTAADYTVWKNAFNTGGMSTIAAAAVPEPTALVCLGLLSVGFFAYRRTA